ncbi:hypothetical protein [Chlorogloeopsis fritschii]|uniref:hypothetical protein n=1 Tax=Chlorogloeopsis fritschii TaxID=1124 RepID=UPI0023F40A44|nr:hypothetical protein [Chlorogloeopsis fritschii]
MVQILLDLDMMALSLREGDRTRIPCCNSNALKSNVMSKEIRGDLCWRGTTQLQGYSLVFNIKSEQANR